MRVPATFALLVLFLVMSPGGAQEARPERPELLVCAETANLPFSDEAEQGVENRLASLLAEELGMELRYRWMDLSTSLRRRVLLERGDCDLVMAVAEGQEGYLTTIAYYLSSYVLVYRADGPLELESLDDPALRTLRIGVQAPAGGNAGPPLEALAVRDLVANAVRFAPDARRDQPLAGVIEAVADGEVDVAIAWGPVAGYFAARQAAELKVVPVRPIIDPPFQPLVAAIAMGARPGDQALVDRLNVALANRWNDVQEILRQAHVPQLPLPQPKATIAAVAPADSLLRIGLVVPEVTDDSPILGSYYTDLLGESARLGAMQAEAELARSPNGPGLELLLASSPDPATAARAARRLIAVEGVDALIGGVGAGQADTLSHIAEEAGILFFNVASPDEKLRHECARYTFHIEASSAMYLNALVEWFLGRGHERWFLLFSRSEEGELLAELAASVLDRHASGADVVGRAGVEPGALSYLAELGAIAAAGADVVVLLLPAEDQIAFLAQQQVSGATTAVAAYPHPDAQTRERLANTLARSLNENLRYRIQLWETTLDSDASEAGEEEGLNERFISRWGRTMDPTAWAAYQAVAAVWAAATELEDFSAAAAVELLEERGAALLPAKPTPTSKPVPVAFRLSDHQLLQPLYVVKIADEATWSNRLSDQLTLAEPVAAMTGGWLAREPRGCPL